MRSLRWAGLLALYVGAQAVGLALAQPFREAGLASTSNPQSPTTPLVFVAVIVVAPIVILLLARRRGGTEALRHLILLAIAGALYFTLYATLALVVFPNPYLPPPYGAELLIDPALIVAAALSASIYLALLMEPQWYVVDLAGFLAAGSLVAILGISFAILPAFVLLGALMVYDAIAVYRTKHMVSLADVVTEMKLPILMVMPDSAGYDYAHAPPLAEQRGQPVEERGAMFMGLGDVVIPGTLVVAAFVWLPGAPVWFGIGAGIRVAVGTLLGSLLGYAVLMRALRGGNPQAGLPFLNGGAILGYVVSYLVVFHSISLGLGGAL